MNTTNNRLYLLGSLFALSLLTSPLLATPVVLDFETEDDFSTPLIHGQIVDPAFDALDLEFGNLVDISSTQDGSDGHLGVTVFDSDRPSDPNDPDLLVGLGNILILQNDDSSATASDTPEGLRYTSPNDERSLDDNGSIVFSFQFPIEPLSIDIVDANGGFGAKVTLIDQLANTRTYTLPEKWTKDISASGANGGPNGFDTLDLTTLLPQDGEGIGGDATVVQDPLYNPIKVVTLKMSFIGQPGGTTSGGIDNLRFNIPEPATLALLFVTSLITMTRRVGTNTRTEA